jgi:anti-sigma factor RsiW
MTQSPVHPDVIRDLAPLYAAGEASAASAALVEAATAADPALARELEALRRALRLGGSLAPSGDLEARALGEVRRAVKRRGTLLATAIFFTVLPLTFAFDQGRITFLLLRDATPVAVAALAGALAAWIGYARLGRGWDARGR